MSLAHAASHRESVTMNLAKNRLPLGGAGVDRDDDDLAGNAPGQQARARAVAEREAAPVRTALARMLRMHTDERAWRLGAEGEEKVGRVLDRLCRQDPGWRVLHSLPIGERGSDIDHLLIGPGGVFTLNAKHHRGARIWVGGNTLLVNGVRQPYLRISRHEAERASRLLSAACGFPVEATAVVVPVNAADIVVKTAPVGVHVINRRRIVRWLRRRVPTLDAATVAAIYATARRSATWKSA